MQSKKDKLTTNILVKKKWFKDFPFNYSFTKVFFGDTNIKHASNAMGINLPDIQNKNSIADGFYKCISRFEL